MLCTLISCTAPKKVDTPSTEAVAVPGQAAAEVSTTNITSGDAVVREHLQNAVNALLVGQAANAKAELAIVMRQEPDNKTARSLLAQIQTDPAKYFSGPEAFNYTLQPGDTLTTIAQRFLDEPLKFYILARFNGINDSSRLAPGRVIKVPGRKPGGNPVAISSEEPPKVSAARSAEESRTQLARRLYDAGKYQQAIEALAGSGAGNNEARDLLSLAYSKYAEELAQNENLIDAQSVLENAVALQPGNDKLRKQLKQVQKQREVERLYKSGTDAMVAGDNDKALETFNAVLKLDPKHEPTKQHIASINAFVVETMHKDAMVEYGKQNLDQAITLWDRVLAISPNHANAKLYRARAMDLKSRLQKMEQKPVANVE